MVKQSRIYVAGHSELVGSAILRELVRSGSTKPLTRTHAAVDLRYKARVLEFFARERPEYAVLAAARVGGILANTRYPADLSATTLRYRAMSSKRATRRRSSACSF